MFNQREATNFGQIEFYFRQLKIILTCPNRKRQKKINVHPAIMAILMTESWYWLDCPISDCWASVWCTVKPANPPQDDRWHRPSNCIGRPFLMLSVPQSMLSDHLYTLIAYVIKIWLDKKLFETSIETRQSVAVQREGGIPVGKKILYQGPWIDPSRSAKVKCNGAAGLIP